MGDICQSDYYHAQMMCESVTQIRDAVQRGEDAMDIARTELDALVEAAETYINNLSASVTYSPDVSGIPSTFTAPTYDPTAIPTAYVVPDASVALISDSDFDDIYDRAADRVAREAERLDWAGQEEANELGLGLPSTVTEARAEEATHKRKELVAQVALEQAVSEATMLREDIKVLNELHLRAYDGATQRWNSSRGIYEVELQREAEKRGWSQMMITQKMELADKQAEYALLIAKAVNDVALNLQQRLAELWVGFGQSMFANVNVGISGRGSASVSTSVSETS